MAPDLSSADKVEAYLDGACGGVLRQLKDEWWEEGEGGARQVRAPYSKAAIGKWLRG